MISSGGMDPRNQAAPTLDTEFKPLRKFRDITYQVFERAQAIYPVGPDKWGHMQWACKCSCGKEFVQLAYRLVNGEAKSCGCLGKEVLNRHARHRGTTHVSHDSLRHHVLQLTNVGATRLYAKRALAKMVTDKQQITAAITSLIRAEMVEVLISAKGEHLRLTPLGRRTWLELGPIDT